MAELYNYRALLRTENDLIDGDTIVLDIDLGMSVWRNRQSCRLYGINTPEVRTRDNDERQAGYAARERLRELIWEHGECRGDATLLMVRTHIDRHDKYGRLLVELLTRDGEDSLNEILIREGHAQPYLP